MLSALRLAGPLRHRPRTFFEPRIIFFFLALLATLRPVPAVLAQSPPPSAPSAPVSSDSPAQRQATIARATAKVAHMAAVASATGSGQVSFVPRPSYGYRMLSGQFQGSPDNSAWTTLATVTQTPLDGQYTTLPTSADPKSYRYLRYLSPDGGECNVAEVEFDSGSGANVVKLTGTGFGTPGSYNNSGNDFTKALDGDPGTFFDSQYASASFVGIDQGAGSGPTLTSIAVSPTTATLSTSKTQQFAAVAKDQNGDALSPQPTFTWSVVSGGFGSINSNTGLYMAGGSTGSATVKAASGSVSGTAAVTVAPANAGEARYCPRSGLASRMVGGKFQGSNDGSTYTDLYTIASQPTDGAWTTASLSADPKTYRYLRYLSPDGYYGNIAELEFYSGTGAGAVRVIGTPFGTPGSWNNQGNDITKVFDGDITTAFDAPDPGNGDFVGIDQQSSQMALTAAGKATGFSLSTFAAGFPQNSGGVGPLGIVFPGSTVLVTDYPGHVRVFPTDADNQIAGSTSPSIVPTATYSSQDITGLAVAGGAIYMARQGTGQVVRVNPDGTLTASNSLVAPVPGATGIAANPANGHLFVTSRSGTSRIYDVNPATNTATAWTGTLNGPDGVTVSADGKTLYVVVDAGSSTDDVLAFDTATQVQVWDYNATAAHTPISSLDGLALGYGNRSGFIYANANDGKVWQIALPGGTSPPGTATLIASGGSRGDFVAVDISGQGSLMLVQSDRILRLFPFPAPVACVPASLSALSLTATTGMVTLSGTALPGGQAVSLTSSNPGVLSVPASVLVPAGATSASFPVTVMPASALVSVMVTAQYHNGPTQTASLTVDNYPKVPQGGSAVTFPATGTDGPAGTTYYGVDVISPSGTVVASTVNSGSLNGWSISDAGPYSSGSRFSVQAPASAVVGAGYEIRAVYSGTNASTFFDVVSTMTPGGGSGGAGGGASDSISAGGMTLTPAAIARGFRLKTFATFPQYPAASAVTSSGKVFVGTFFGGIMYVLPSDQDGQDGSLAPYISNGAFGMSTVDGEHVYMTSGGTHQLNPDGTTNPNFQGPGGLDIAVNPINGHIITDNLVDIDPTTGETRQFATGGGDGVAVSADGLYAFVATGGIAGYNIATGVQEYNFSNLNHSPDGIAAGGGSLSGKIYTNNPDGSVSEIDLVTGSQTEIALGGTRGDLAKIDQTNGTFLISQGGGNGYSPSLLRLIPPAGGSFGPPPGRAVYTRDDLSHPSAAGNHALTQTYAPFGISGSQTTNSASIPAGFDTTGLSGIVSAAQMQRAGQTSFAGGGSFDLEWGLSSLDPAVPASFGPLQQSAQAGGSPSPYQTSWALPDTLLADLQAQLGNDYRASLIDRLSSLCGSANFADTPHQNWPVAKNVLTFVAAPKAGIQIPQGRCLDVILNGTDRPLNGSWDIVRDGAVIASSGQPSGWDAEDDHTVYGGAIITVPASAAGVNYELRFVGQAAGSAPFAVAALGVVPTAAILRPLVLSQPAAVGGASGTLTGTVSLDAPAPRGQAPDAAHPAGGVYVTLTSSSSAVSVPAYVFISAGQTSATFSISTSSVSTPTSVSLLASYNGYRAARLGVLPTGSTIGVPGGPGTPPAPTTLTATGGDAKVSLKWNASAGATEYSIFRSLTKGGGYALLFVGQAGTTFADTAVTNGVTYYYVVMAHNLYGYSLYSNEASATPLGGQVATPTITASGTATNGTYTAPLAVSIMDATPGAVIRYTTDRTVPTSISTPFSTTLQLQAGTTTVTAAAYKAGLKPSATATATFVVTPSTPPTLYAIACGSTATRPLGSAPSQTLGNGFYADYYTFTGTAGELKTITLTSDAFDTYLVLRDPSGNIVATNDDAPAGTTVSKWTSLIAYTLLTSGTYTIEVTSYTPGVTGSTYTLNLACTTPVPHLVVSSGGTALPNASAPYSPAPVGPILDYGTTPAGVRVSKTFTLQNTGTADLTLSSVTVPTGFTLTSPLTSPIPAGQSEPFVLRFDAVTSVYSSSVSFFTNDPLYVAGTTTPSYSFSVQGYTSSGGARATVPQGGSNTFALSYVVPGLPGGGWYIQDPGGKIVGSSDASFGATNGWNVTLAADTTTVTVTAPASAPILTGYNVYVTQGTPYNAASFDVIPTAVPTNPLTLTAQGGNTQVLLKWNAALNAASYNLYRGTSPNGEGATAYKTGLTGTSYTDTGLTNSTTYYYQIAAANSIGEGTRSNEASATPQALATPVLTASAGNASVTLNWSSITGATSYSIYRGNYPGYENFTTPVATGVTALTYSDASLNNNSTYYYEVKAFGPAGATSNYSNEAQATPQAASSQTAPVLLSAVPGNGSVSLTWSTVSGANYYYVYYSTTPGGSYNYGGYFPAPASSGTVSGLTNGTTYYFVVQVYTSTGSSTYSNELKATPNLPLNLAAQAGNALVKLTWSAASGAATYNLYRGITANGEAATPVQTGLTDTSFTDTGRTNGTAYYYQLTAVNTAGNEGAKSNEASATPAAVPAIPLNLVAQAGNASVSLTWSVAAGKISYNVKRATTRGGPYTIISTAGSVTTEAYTDSTAVNGTTYYYVVAAVNASGESPLSNEASATPIAPSDTPLNLAAVAGNASVQLQWSAAARAASYNIYRGTTPGGENLTTPITKSLTTTFTDAPLTNGTTYYYVVKAVNAGGISAVSNEASATPTQAATATPTLTARYTSGPQSGVVIPSGGKFNLPSGTAASVTLQSATPGALLYDTQGTPAAPPAAPTTASAQYNTPLALTGSAVIKAIAAASSYGTSPVATGTYTLNALPTVTLSSPNGSAFHTGDSVPLLATASDTDGTVTQVQFLATLVVGGTPTTTQYLVGTASASPFQITWAGVPAGSYSLTAVATDNDGGTATSAAVPITVGNPITQTIIACNQIFGGSLRASDGASTVPSFGDHFADQYTFTGAASQTVTLSLSSSAFDTYLVLRDPSGTVVATNDDAGSLTHDSQIVYTLPATVPGNGIYTIEVTSASAGATGAYTLAMDCSGGSAAPALSASYQVGQTVTTVTSGGTAVDFGAVPMNTPVSRTITLKNTGTADLNLTGISGSDSHFTLTSSPASPIAPGQTTSFTVVYSASDVQARTATVTLTNNSAVSPFVINLRVNSQTPPALTVSSLVFSPASVPGGTQTKGTVTLSGAAPAGGQAVTLAVTTGDKTLLPLPALVNVPAGKTSIDFTVTTPETATGGTVTAAASFTGGGSQNGSLTVTASQLVSVSFSPSAVSGGAPSTGTVTLRSASASARVVTLAAPNSSGVVVPTSVTVFANTTTQDFSVATSAVTSSASITVTASFAGISKTAVLTVNPSGTAPSVTITNTTNNGTQTTSFQAPAAVTINATVTAGTAAVQKVAFYESQDGGATFVKLGELPAASYGSSYSFTWTNAPAGSYSLKAVVTDTGGRQASSALYPITVSAAPSVAAPVITPVGGAYTGLVTVTMTDSQAGAIVRYTLDGTDPAASSPQYLLPLWVTSTTTVKAKAFLSGYAPSATSAQTYTLTAGSSSPVSVQITPPKSTAADMGVPLLTQPTAITGTVTSTVAGNWELDYRPVQGSDSGGGAAAFIPFASGTFSTTGGTPSGILDTTLLLNGLYEVRLSAVTNQGTAAAPASQFVRVQGGEKVGYFTLSYNDLTLPVAGLPIQITRTYDSRDKSAGDFGTGWTLSSTNVKLQKTGVLGYNWTDVKTASFIPSYSVIPQKPHLITITFPDGTVYNFAAVLSPDTAQGGHLIESDMFYQALPGTRGTLKAVNTNSGVVISSGTSPDDTNPASAAVELYDDQGVQLYDCHEFQLTLPDGRVFDINDTQGLQSVQDANGNTLSFSYGAKGLSGISSSRGPGVGIKRDSSGRITEIDPPTGAALLYGSTDGLSNLTAFTDRAGYVTTFDYDALHNLTGIHDPRGILPIRNYYKADGRLDYSLDAHNQKISYAYDPNLLLPGSHQETVVDRLGHQTLITYDSYGNVTQTQKTLYDQNGYPVRQLTASATFNPSDPNNPDKKISETVPGGLDQNGYNQTRQMDYQYNALGNLTQVTRYRNYNDATSSFTAVKTNYDGAGRPLTVTDAMNVVVTTNKYDGVGNLYLTTDALGHETKFFYTNGLLTSTQDAQGHLTRYGYDPQGDVTGVTDAQGHATGFGYDLNGNKTSQTTTRTNSATGLTETLLTQFFYDGADRLTKTIAPDGATSQTFYNSLGKVDYTVDTIGRTTRYVYDELGQLVQTISPDGTSTYTTYDANGQRLTSTDRAGRVSASVYDSLGRVVQSGPVNPAQPFLAAAPFSGGMPTPNWLQDTSGHAEVSTTAYDDSGAVVQGTDALGRKSSSTFDPLGRTLSATDAAGGLTQYTYDDDDRQKSVTDALKHVTSYDYDLAGRQTVTHYDDGSTSKTDYDELGRRISQTDQADHTTRYDYDSLGRLYKVTDPLSHVSQFGYDELGEKISQTDANQHTTQFAYDLRGRLVTKMLPLGQMDGRTYDTLGRLATMTDFNGRVMTFGYEDLTGRLLSKTAGAESVSFAYNGDGTRKSAVRTTASGSVTTAYAYYGTGDFRQGQLQSVTTTAGGVSRTVSYDYDVLGEKIATQTPSLVSGSKSVGYGYDVLGRLSTVTHPDGAITTFGYDKVGNRQSVTRRALATAQPFSTTTYTYDTLNRLTDIVNQNASNGLVSKYHYTLRPDGKRQNVTESVPPAPDKLISYIYDDSGKLTQESGPYATIAYGYDNVGNRITRSVTGSTTALLPNGVTNNTYDLNDRITTVNGSVTHSYDDDGNEKTVAGQTASYDFENHLVGLGSGATSYVYDADGNRVSVTTGGTTTGFVVDTSLPYASVVEEYSGTTLANGTLAARYDYGDDLIRMDWTTPSVSTSYYLYDGLGSTRQLVNTSGAVTDTWGYSAFGEQVSRTGSTVNAFLFNAQQFDQPTGTYFLRARYYDQSNGRFLSQDPFGGNNDDPVSLHRYLYANVDPIDVIDPSGRDGELAETLTASAASESIRSVKTSSDIEIYKRVSDTLLFGPDVAVENFTLDIVSQVLDSVPGGQALQLTATLTEEGINSWEPEPGRQRTPGDSWTMYGEGDGGKLGANLRRANIHPPTNEADVNSYAAHHIVPGNWGPSKKGYQDIQRCREILTEHGITANDPANGVWLAHNVTGGSNGSFEGAYHPRIHTEAYARTLRRTLENVSSQEECINALRYFGQGLRQNKIRFRP